MSFALQRFATNSACCILSYHFIPNFRNVRPGMFLLRRIVHTSLTCVTCNQWIVLWLESAIFERDRHLFPKKIVNLRCSELTYIMIKVEFRSNHFALRCGLGTIKCFDFGWSTLWLVLLFSWFGVPPFVQYKHFFIPFWWRGFRTYW